MVAGDGVRALEEETAPDREPEPAIKAESALALVFVCVEEREEDIEEETESELESDGGVTRGRICTEETTIFTG